MPPQPHADMAAKMKGTRSRQDNFLPNSEPRAPVKARNRKRRPSGEEPMPLIKDHAIKSISGMRTTCTWDLDQESTDAILEDIGVSFMEEDNIQESVAPTPPTYLHDAMVPPPAPRISMSLYPQQTVIAGGNHNESHIATPTLAYMEPQGTMDDTFLFKRARSDAVAGTDHWTKLSDEIILSILRWLPKPMLVRCARVCKRWKRLSFDETLWRRMDLANKTLRPGVVGRVLQRGVAVLRLTKTEIQTPIFVESSTAFNSSTWSSGIGSANNSLNLSMDTSLNNSCMSMDISMNASVNQQRLTRVQYLDLSMATINLEGLEELLANTHYLRKLSLENCEVNDTICRYIGQNRNLEVLNMCMCQGMTENGLVPICNNLQRLEALNVGWTNMSRGAVVYLLICLPLSLLKLNLSGCRDTLMDEDVQQLCGSCPHLKELDLSDATMLTSQSVEHIASQLRGLEYVALSRCYHIAPSSFMLLGNILTLLAVDVFGMLKESALQQLREAMPSIEINKFPFSSIARPTTGIRRTSIWGLRVRDSAV